MINIKKGFTLIEVLVIIAIVGILAGIILSAFGHASQAQASAKGCDGWFEPSCSSQNTEAKQASNVQKNLMAAVPIPQLTNSLERENVAKRAQIFNTPDKVSYIYLVSYGKVMAFYSVLGKVSSLQSYMVPTEKIVRGDGSACSYYSEGNCYEISAPDIDGTYGENVSGIFFFTTEGAYVEWRGDYMMSDQPLKLTTTPELVRTVK